LVGDEEWVAVTSFDGTVRALRFHKETGVLDSEFTLVSGLYKPDGIIFHGDSLYVGTSADKVDSGSMAASIVKISGIAAHVQTRSNLVPSSQDVVVFEHRHISLRPRHPFQAMRLTPDNKYMLIFMGNGANWGPDSTGSIIAKDMQTGDVYSVATGLRNPTDGVVHEGVLYISMMASDVGQHTASFGADGGAFGPSDVILKMNMAEFTLPAPENTLVDDREGLLKWIGSSCDAESVGCDVIIDLESRLPTGASSVEKYILCPHTCAAHIASLNE